MHTTNHSNRRLFLLPGCWLLCLSLLAACSSGASSNTTGSPTVTRTSTNVATTATNPVVTPTQPATQTSCPASGTARAAVMPPLALGTHQNIVYIVNEYQGSNPTFGTLKRYDVATGAKTEIVKIPSVSISSAQVSADGQWILFTAGSSQQGIQKLQLVRMDGQVLQTLYCGNFYETPRWSSNQQVVAIPGNQQNFSDVYLLHLQSGSLQRVFHPDDLTSNRINAMLLGGWLDTTHLYLLTQHFDGPADGLAILDITRGSDQNFSNLQQVSGQYDGFCGDFDSSYDGAHLYISDCFNSAFSGEQPVLLQGPSSIVVEPATGGTPHTIYTTATLAITEVRSISKTSLLFIVSNRTGDTSHNGLWEIRTDGTGLIRLTNDNPNQPSGFAYVATPWSNVSRDGSMYAVTTSTYQRSPVVYTLSFGSLSGGTITTFASISDGTHLAIVGWTTM